MRARNKPRSGYTSNNEVQLLKGGTEYFGMLENLITNAKHSIHIRIYIWDNDATGQAIADQLIAAARRNVKVYVIADGYASQRLPGSFIKKLREEGINFKFFEPLFKGNHFYIGRRMHEKVVAVDGTDALVGGINFADRYNEVNGIPAWLDYALHTRGEIAYKLYRYCTLGWQTHDTLLPEPLFDNARVPCSVRISRNDWLNNKSEIWTTYFRLVNQAEETITIICSYFLPGRVLRKRLKLAARRGVDVKIILAGPSDVMIAKHAERYLYPWFLRNNIKLYEYEPTVLHAKLMVVDAHWVTAGSFNVNNISTYASVELNLDVRNKPFATYVQEQLNDIIEKDCIPVTAKNFILNATILKRLVHKISYEFIRLMLRLFTSHFNPKS